MTLQFLTQAREIIEDGASKCAWGLDEKMSPIEQSNSPFSIALDSYREGAELVLKALESAISQRNNYLSQKVYTNVQFEAYKKELNQELLSILKGGEK